MESEWGENDMRVEGGWKVGRESDVRCAGWKLWGKDTGHDKILRAGCTDTWHCHVGSVTGHCYVDTSTGYCHRVQSQDTATNLCHG